MSLTQEGYITIEALRLAYMGCLTTEVAPVEMTFSAFFDFDYS